MAKYMRVQGGVGVELRDFSYVIEKSVADPSVWVRVSDTNPPALGMNWDGATWSSPAPVIPQVPDALRALAAYHDMIEAKGIWFQGSAQSAPALFATDPAGIGKITAAYAAAISAPSKWVDGQKIRALDNLFYPMTGADVIALAEKALAYIAGCTERASALAEIITTSNPAVALTGAWPSNA